MSHIRKCICCGVEYEYCPNCNSDSRYPKWMVSYDTESCKDVFNVVSGYNMGIISADSVKGVLNKYSITDYSKYKDSIAKVLKEITKANEQPVKADEPAKVNEPVKTENYNFGKKNKHNNKVMDMELGETKKVEEKTYEAPSKEDDKVSLT